MRACGAVNEPIAMLLSEIFGQRSEAPRRFTLRRSGCALYLRPRSSDLRVFHEIFCYRGYELPDHVRRLLSEMPLVIDAGANIGLFALFVCQSVVGVKVKAFEPDPQNALIARRTLAGLIDAGRVELVEAAVGTFEGRISFVTGMGMISRRAAPGDDRAALVWQVDLLEELQGVGLLKLDIEGAEWDILRDRRWSKRMPACLVMEWHALHEDQREPNPVGEVARLLSAANDVQHTVFDAGVVGHVWAFR